MRYPETKLKAKECEDIGVQWGPSKPLGTALVHYLNDLGAGHELPEDKIELVEYVRRVHKRLTVGNIHCPEDIPFEIIYSSFISAVLNGSAELPEYQPHSIANQLKCFKQWITSGNTLDRLYESYYSQHPEARPKQLENKSTKLENWPDKRIKKQYQTICRVFGDGAEDIPIFKTSGAESYFNRIRHEYEARNL